MSLAEFKALDKSQVRELLSNNQKMLLAPEYHTSQRPEGLSGEKFDIFSLGVTLLLMVLKASGVPEPRPFSAAKESDHSFGLLY